MSHLSKSSRADLVTEVWKWSRNKLLVWSLLHHYFFPVGVLCCTVIFALFHYQASVCKIQSKQDETFGLTKYLQMDHRRSKIVPHCPFRCDFVLQDVAKSHLKPQLQHRKHWVPDKEYLVFPGSWGQNLSSWDDAHYCWAYTQKRGIRQRGGLRGATLSLNWTQVSETNCCGGPTFSSLQIKMDGEIVFPPRMADGTKYGSTCITLRRIWQLLIVFR